MLYDKTYMVKKQVTDWKKTFAETIDKRIAFRIYKPPKTTDKKKTNTPTENGQRV